MSIQRRNEEEGSPAAPRLQDVAELAGVNKTTARAALCGDTKRPEAVARVRAAAEALGYVYTPRRLGGRLYKGRSTGTA